MSTDARSARIDVPTVIAISALAYTLANIVHEGLGHGGTCVLVGARPTVLNAIFFEYDEQAATLVQLPGHSAHPGRGDTRGAARDRTKLGLGRGGRRRLDVLRRRARPGSSPRLAVT